MNSENLNTDEQLRLHLVDSLLSSGIRATNVPELAGRLEAFVLDKPQSSEIEEVNKRLDAIEEKLSQPVEMKLTASWPEPDLEGAKRFMNLSRQRREQKLAESSEKTQGIHPSASGHQDQEQPPRAEHRDPSELSPVPLCATAAHSNS
jgi:hypothetical protein